MQLLKPTLKDGKRQVEITDAEQDREILKLLRESTSMIVTKVQLLNQERKEKFKAEIQERMEEEDGTGATETNQTELSF